MVPREHDQGEYCEIDDLVETLKPTTEDPERWKNNEASRKPGKGTDTAIALNGSPDPGKLGSKIDHNKIFEGKKNLKPVRADEVTQSTQVLPKPVYQNLDPLSTVGKPINDLLKPEPTALYTQVNRSKQKLKPVSKNADLDSSSSSLPRHDPTAKYTKVNLSKHKPFTKSVDTIREPFNTLQKQEKTPTYTEIKRPKQKPKPIYLNVSPALSAPELVYDELREPGHDRTLMLTEVGRPSVKPKPLNKKPDPPKKDSKSLYTQIMKSMNNATGSGTKAPVPPSKPPGGNKMTNSKDPVDDQELYATHVNQTNDGFAIDNDLYA